ncbi:ABC transporter permease [Oscillatoria amoena NRMC-F 0135]|nr:ABC transporter permease [Oscillatoria amoena NRMC-F 0135]
MDEETKMEFHSGEDNRLRIVLSGRLDIHANEKFWSGILARIGELPAGAHLTIDARGVDYCDVSGLSLLVKAESSCRQRQISCEITGLAESFDEIRRKFTDDQYLFESLKKPVPTSIPEDVGRSTVSILHELRSYVEYTGQVCVVIVRALAQPGSIRWRDVVTTFEKAGVNALPVVALISFLVGLIISFQAAIPMRQFGVEIFVVNLLTIAVLRELGAFMTALVLSGRSGSAFAAEIGTMKVNEEVNALITMGIDPVRFLVVSRLIAGILLMPFLTIFSNVIAIAGGLVVMMLQGFTPDAFFNQFKQAFRPVDLWVGLIKSFFFGAIVAGAGCYQGLKTLSGPTAVGDSTTKAVVSCIVLIVAVDGIFSVVLYFLKL